MSKDDSIFEMLKCPECGDNNFFKVIHVRYPIELYVVSNTLEMEENPDNVMEYPDDGDIICETCENKIVEKLDDDGNTVGLEVET